MIEGYPARFEGLSGVLGQFAYADAVGRPQGWLAGHRERVQEVGLDSAQAELSAVLDPDHLAVVVVGDFAAVGAEVEALGLGEVWRVDDEGTRLAPSGP